MHLLQVIPALSLIIPTIAHPLSNADEITSSNPTIVARGALTGHYPWIAQYNVSDCSSGLINDRKLWPDINTGAGVVHNFWLEPRPYIHPHNAPKEQCVPWYPVVDQQHAPGVGIFFGTKNESISQLQIFKETPECIAAYNDPMGKGAHIPVECCDESKGLLGVINANGSSDAFGATKGLGSKVGACVNIGKDGNQAFWQMRYMKAIV